VGGKVVLRWSKGVFVLNNATSPDKLEADSADDRMFLDILAELARSGREVSQSSGKTYAPALFAKNPAAKGISNARFEAAMERLFAANRIHNPSEGPPSKLRKFVTAGPAPLPPTDG
jgi:RecA-family ATPase